MVDSELGSRLEATLSAVARMAKDAIGSCDSAGVTLVRNRKVVGGACTDEVARNIDLVQYDAGEGPCLDAVRYLQIFYITSIRTLDSWPSFRQASLDHGIRSSLSVPMSFRGYAVGMLNLYSRAANGFEECDELATAFASRAAEAIWEAEGAGSGRAGRSP
jgi:putative methionine-R-sulfoxide reductase with GAF domain